jgi:hypothetical protein
MLQSDLSATGVKAVSVQGFATAVNFDMLKTVDLSDLQRP